MITLNNMGQRIKERRTALGWTQWDLAQKLGYTSKAVICKIEKGERDIAQSKVLGFADALLTTPEYLLGLTDDPNPKSIKVNVEDDLFMIAKKLDPEKYAMLLSYAKLLDKA